jgi:hypothetical protein
MFRFVKRRDIFPIMFVYCTLILLIYQLILLDIYYNVHLKMDNTELKKIVMTQFVRMTIYSAIWVSFLLTSERVKQTFIYPYR